MILLNSHQMGKNTTRSMSSDKHGQKRGIKIYTYKCITYNYKLVNININNITNKLMLINYIVFYIC